MLRWLEIAGQCSEVRFRVLSEFMRSNGVENEVQFINCDAHDFPRVLSESIGDYNALRIGTPFGMTTLDHFEGQPSTMMFLKAADGVIFEQGKWWPRSSGYRGLQKVLGEVGRDLDLNSSILVVGSGAQARVACAAFSKLGFRRFLITSRNDEHAEELVKQLERHFFNLEFKVVPQDQLVLLPGVSSAVINTTPYALDNDLLTELYYFNFLQSSGVVIDLNLQPLETPLIREAKVMGVNVVMGSEVASWSDILWCQWVTGKTFDRSVYRDALEAALFASSPVVEPQVATDSAQEEN